MVPRFGSNIKYSDTVNGQTDGITPRMSSQCISMLGTLTKHLSPGFHQSPKVKVSYQHIPFTKKYKSTERKYFVETFKPIFLKKLVWGVIMAIIKRTNSKKNVGKEKYSRRWEGKLCSHQGTDVEASKKQLIQVHKFSFS